MSFYSPNWLDQKTANGPFGLQVKLPPAHLSTIDGGGFTLSLLLLNVKQGSCDYQFYCPSFDRIWNRTRVYRFSCRRSIHSTTERVYEVDFNAKILKINNKYKFQYRLKTLLTTQRISMNIQRTEPSTFETSAYFKSYGK